MKIAIPSDDRIQIAAHFGRTLGFKIFEVQNNTIISEAYRPNDFTGHAMGLHDQQGHEHQHHSHGGILEALADCEVVIAGGMGRRLFDDLSSVGKKVYVTQEEIAVDAVKLFLENNLSHDSDICCQH